MPNPAGNPKTLTPYKPKWHSGPTQVIRVPIALASQVMEYARSIDSKDSNNLGQNKDNEPLVTVIKKLEVVLETPRNNFSREKKAILLSAIQEIKALVTSDKEGLDGAQ